MADKTISNLLESLAVEDRQAFPVEDNVSTKKMTIGTLKDFLMKTVDISFAKKDLSNLSQKGSERMIPAGSVIAFAGKYKELPGYLYCDGAMVSKTTYSDLFAVISSDIAIKSKSEKEFRLPDLRGLFLRGCYNKTQEAGLACDGYIEVKDTDKCYVPPAEDFHNMRKKSKRINRLPWDDDYDEGANIFAVHYYIKY